MAKEHSQGFSTRAIHAGQPPDPTTGAIMFPIYQTSTFVQASPGQYKDGFDYSRTKNPTRTALEVNLAALENGSHAITFASGCAAMAATLHLLSHGDHVVMCDDVYGGTFRLIDKIFKPLGVNYTMVRMQERAALEAAFTSQTKLVWIETPTNPLLQVIDIQMVAEVAKKRGAYVAVDNTFATPYLQTPLSLGADIVAHSSTKYIGGHSDVVGGVLVVKDASLADRLYYIQNAVGAVPSPHDCFLLLRSTKTLAVRMERHCQNASAIAQWLSEQSGVEKVLYPGLPSHPQYSLAKRQMRGFGGMISIELAGGLAVAKRFLERVKLFSLGESLGGVESLIEHPAIMTHASIPKEQRDALGISDGLIRLSVGIEEVDDLIDDLKTALR